MIIFLGILTLFFSFSAYFQKDRIKFLILNASAIATIGISFYIKGGYVGAFAELLMFIIHITAIIFNDNVRKKLSLFVPPLIFISYLYIHGFFFGYEIIMPFIMSLFVLGAYQTNMLKNKIFFMLGLSLMSIYSYFIGTYFVLFSNILGIVILYKTYLDIKGNSTFISGNAFQKR